MSLLSNFRILVGIPFGPSLLCRFKDELILKTSKISVDVIKNVSMLSGERWSKCFFFENGMKDKNITVWTTPSFVKRGDWLPLIWQYGWGWNIFPRKGGDCLERGGFFALAWNFYKKDKNIYNTLQS